MKKLLPKLWVKITAFILLIATSLTAAFSGIGIAYLFYYNAYGDNGDAARQRAVAGGLFWEQIASVQEYCEAYLQDKKNQEDQANQANQANQENQANQVNQANQANQANQEDQTQKTAEPALQLASFAEQFAERNNNFFFSVKDSQGTELLRSYTNPDYLYTYTDTREIIFNHQVVVEELTFQSQGERMNYVQACWQDYSDIHYVTWEKDTNSDGRFEYGLNINYMAWETKQVSITGWVKKDLTAPDAFFWEVDRLNKLVNARYDLLVWCIPASLASLFLFIFLLCGAGRKEGVEGVHLHWFHRIPFDLYLVLLVVAASVALQVTFDSVSYAGTVSNLLYDFIAAAVSWSLLLSLPLTFAARVKAGEWWKNTVIYFLLSRCKRGLYWFARGVAGMTDSLPLLWKAGIVFLGIVFVEFVTIVICRDSIPALLFLWFLGKIVLAAAGILLLAALRKLEKGGQEIAAGNLSHTVDLGHMFGAFKKHGENLNNISSGMQLAVEERMKSERMKTELITNVSHDIKTPLTSIVNYVDLLKKEETTPEQAKEYIAVLDRQSSRLKKLTEDLVEASKASTGNMSVTLEQVDINLLLSQAVGEYEARLSERRLVPVLTLSPHTPRILADGRLLWRVFDNLLSNICKYALEGTRVYLTTEGAETFAVNTPQGRVQVSFKNVSNYPLNISSDELMERFVRGDASRSTEGSGLGLSIAKSLTELQKGHFDMAIDGDLFKTALTFDRAE